MHHIFRRWKHQRIITRYSAGIDYNKLNKDIPIPHRHCHFAIKGGHFEPTSIAQKDPRASLHSRLYSHNYALAFLRGAQ